MQISLAQVSDIDEVLQLQTKYHVASIAEADQSSGFVTTLFTEDQLKTLITDEGGLSIARDGGRLVAYVMAASWEFWSHWPIFVHMIDGLDKLTFLGNKLTVENSYQYGPVYIDASVRGSGLLEAVFDFSRAQMAMRYPVLLTFINKTNTRSFAAHTQKLGLQVIQEFAFNGNQYHELAYDTSKSILK
jgi:hypothetical protein